MGTLRLFLAITVVVYHMGLGGLLPINAITAVQLFFIISGYVVTKIIDGNYYRDSNRKLIIKHFYLSRFFRLYPTYVAALFLALINEVLSLTEVVKNISSLPTIQMITAILLNLSMFGLLDPKMNGSVESWILVPPAWSLTCEIIFYVVIPHVLKMSKRHIKVVLFISCVGLLLLESKGLVLVIDNYFPIARLGWFLLGSITYFGFKEIRLPDNGKFIRIKSLIISILLVFFLSLFLFLSYNTGFNERAPLNSISTWVLVSFFLIIMLLLDQISKKNKLDIKAGELSYPMYILHDPIIVFYFGVFSKQDSKSIVDIDGSLFAIIVFASIVFLSSLATSLLEKPITKWRWEKFRSNKA